MKKNHTDLEITMCNLPEYYSNPVYDNNSDKKIEDISLAASYPNTEESKSILERPRNSAHIYKVNEQEKYAESRAVLVSCKEMITSFENTNSIIELVTNSCMFEIKRLIQVSIQDCLKSSKDGLSVKVNDIIKESDISSIFEELQLFMKSVIQTEKTSKLYQQYSIMGSLLIHNLRIALELRGIQFVDLGIINDFIVEYIDFFS